MRLRRQSHDKARLKAIAGFRHCTGYDCEQDTSRSVGDVEMFSRVDGNRRAGESARNAGRGETGEGRAHGRSEPGGKSDGQGSSETSVADHLQLAELG